MVCHGFQEVRNGFRPQYCASKLMLFEFQRGRSHAVRALCGAVARAVAGDDSAGVPGEGGGGERQARAVCAGAALVVVGAHAA